MMRQIAVRTHLMKLSWVQHTQPITAGELLEDSLKSGSFCDDVTRRIAHTGPKNSNVGTNELF